MKIEKLEQRQQWVCEFEGHSYVRTEITWTDVNRPSTTTWSLNEDQIINTTYPSGEQLEEVFQKEIT